MPIGANQGGNLNVFIFEVGMITRDEFDVERVQTVGLHPLLVAPAMIQYTDTSRSPVDQTYAGSHHTINGRALRSVSMRGSFGIESRGLGPYIGTGEVRFQRFYREVVRLGEAISSAQVEEAVDILQGTPGLSLQLATYDPNRTSFFINFYDFFNDRRFACQVRQWSDSREYGRGGASGLVHYSMQIGEVGPIVTGGAGQGLVTALMNGLTTWNAVNEVLESYDAESVLAAGIAPATIAISELADTLDAVTGQIDSATRLMGGQLDPNSSQLTAYLAQTVRLQQAAAELNLALQARASDEVDSDQGAVDWGSVSGEGSNLELDLSDYDYDLGELVDAAAYQSIAGVFYGMGDEAFQTFLSDGGATEVLAPDLVGTVLHTVLDTDTAASIESYYGVDWERILETNEYEPDEALVAGTMLRIPRRRARGPQSIDGLPTFGSHIGEAAWGIDLDVDMPIISGDFVTVESNDVLHQGIEWLTEEWGPSLLKQLAVLPGVVHERWLALVLQRIFESDQRIAAVRDLVVTTEGAGDFNIETTMLAINGGTIRTGSPST